MKRCGTIIELRKEFDAVKSIVAGDTRFMAVALMFIAERMEQSTAKPPRDKRKRTEWQKFFAAGMKASKPAKQIAQEWQARKAAK